MWLEHSLSPKVQGDLAAWFGSVPSVPAACKGNELLTDEGCATNGFEDFDKIKFWKTPVSQVRKPGRVRALLSLGLRLHRASSAAADRSRARSRTSSAVSPSIARRTGAPPGLRHDRPAVSFQQRLAPFRRRARRRRRRSRHRRGRVLRHARPVRLGQDHLPAPDRRLRAADRRPYRDLRRDRRGRAALPAQRQHRVPGLRAVPAHERRRQRRLRADGPRRRQGRAAQGRRGGARPGQAAGLRRRAARRSSPAASASASRSPARSSTSRRCCCSTSRSARSTSSCASRCRRN